jgi:hypothetical protein
MSVHLSQIAPAVAVEETFLEKRKKTGNVSHF